MQDRFEQLLTEIPMGRILGIDYGQQRIGVALSDPSQMLSSTYKTFANKNSSAIVQEILSLVKEKNIVAIIVGMPYNMNGTMGEKAEEVTDFIEEIRKQCSIPVVPWDERWTTKSAHNQLINLGKSPSRNRELVDRVAAAIILQSFLDRLSHFRKKVQSLNL